MRKIRVILLTLILSISMLAPELSMIPAAYAQDETPAVTQSADNTGDAAGTDAGTGSGAGALTATPAAPGETTGAATDTANGAQGGAADEGKAAAGLQKAGAANDAAGADDSENPAGAAKAGADDPENPAGTAKGDGDEPEEPAAEFGSYDKLQIADLYEAGKITFSEGVKEPVEEGSGLLFSGKVGDLNGAYINIDVPFDFNEGSVGRVTFDGLKDKTSNMDVDVEVYFDGSKSPSATIPLKRQMGKVKWANDGEKSVTLGTGGFKGEHSVALRFKITGVADSEKTNILLRSIRFFKATVPIMYFNIDESQGTIEAMNSSEDHSVECCGTVDLVVPDEFNNDESFRDEYKRQDSLYGLDLEYIRGRGNSTWMDDKKPYKVKLNEKQDLFGFGENAHWVLLANRFDNSLVRNRMTYRLGRELGMEFTPECVPVEVVMNGEFYGSYLLCEQIRVGKGRVEIDDLDKVKDAPAVTDEIIETGGYLLSMDVFSDDEVRAFGTKNGMNFYIESPEDNVAYYNDYIKAYTQKVEDAIYDGGVDDTDENMPLYAKYLDLNAAVDYWWIQEFSANGDAYSNGSTYLYKKRVSDTEAGKLYWGPLWDFDFVAWGDLDYAVDVQTTLDNTTTPWFTMLMSDPTFINRVKERWTEAGGLHEMLVKITQQDGLLDKYLAQMETSYNYDHEKWGPYESSFTEYKDEIEQLREWIVKRTGFVDEEVDKFSTEPHHVTFVIDGKIVDEKDLTGAIYGKDFPEVPEKPGYLFVDWIDEEENSYKDGSIITSDLVLTARYVKNDELVQAEDIFFGSYDICYPVYLKADGNDNETLDPVFTVMPADADKRSIKWTSSDESVAKVTAGSGSLNICAYGDTTITATLTNGKTKSYNLHVVNYGDVEPREESVLDKTSLTLSPGEYSQIQIISTPLLCTPPEFIWLSMNEDVAKVDEVGVVTGVAPGTTNILAVSSETREIMKCSVTVTGGEGGDSSNNNPPADNTGATVTYNGSDYQITSDKEGARTAMLVKAKNAKSVTIPASVKLNDQTYEVNSIKAKAFSKSKAKKLTVKTKKLSKARVKGSLKGSKIKKVKVKVGKKKTNKKYVKKYKKYFKKKNCGKKVRVY